LSDLPIAGQGWRILPQDYLAARAKPFRRGAPISQYVVMPDGVRLALDVYLPQAEAPAGPVPTILVLTPYYRRFRLAPGAPATSEPAPGAARIRDMFVPHGYALVVVDVRGTGASFGTRDAFRSPIERTDSAAVADWIVAQPWSNGLIGSTGISYVGAAADFLASTGHPAVVAIAPLFSVWDTYADHYYPGGMLLQNLAQGYDDLMVALDHDRREMLPRFAYFADPHFRGPMPVDDDPDGAEVTAAVAQHRANFHMPDFIRAFACKDDALPYDPSFTSASFSPYHYAASISPEVAVYSVSGWMDGAGYTNGAIARFRSLPNPSRHLLLGPWDHGARMNVSPFRATPAAQFPLMAELLRFFDHYLMRMPTGLEAEAAVHAFVMREERWHALPDWPVAEAALDLHLATDAALVADAQNAGEDSYLVDLTLGTGPNTRYGRLAALDVRDYYPDWDGRDAAMLCFTGGPLQVDNVLAGAPSLTLRLACSEADAALHVYLEDVAPDGAARYVTEGMLRLLHRKEAPAPALHQVVGPYRSFARGDAAPMVPGVAVEIRLDLLPTAWRFPAGHRIRLAISGADADNYGQVPHGRPPTLTVFHAGSALSLPLLS
jgi:putative CocE/NonD family hydrolase